MSGVDTTSSPLYLIADFIPNHDIAITVDAYVEFDTVVYIDTISQQCTVRF